MQIFFKLLVVLAVLCGTPIKADQGVVSEVVNILEKHFWKEIHVPEVAQTSLDKLYSFITKIDPYFSVEKITEPETARTGFYGAILLTPPANGDFMLLPLQGGKMESIGFSDPIVLHKVSGVNTRYLGQSEVRGMFERDTSVAIEYRLANDPTTREAVLTKGKQGAKLPHVLRFNMSYGPVIQFHRFEFAKTARDIKRLLPSEVSGNDCIILDLRYNQGGDVAELPNVVELFATSVGEVGVLSYRSDQRPSFERIRILRAKGRIGCAPIIMVSQYTASAAEVFVNALRRLSGAIVIGEQTFGKCQSQKSFKLSNNHSIKITNSTFASGRGRCKYQGLTPDIIEENIAQASITDIALLAVGASLDNRKSGNAH